MQIVMFDNVPGGNVIVASLAMVIYNNSLNVP